jgi:hypothetical protein
LSSLALRLVARGHLTINRGASVRPARRKLSVVPAIGQPKTEPVLGPATSAAIVLARLLDRQGDSWRVRIGDEERILPADASVDPALLEEAALSGARAVVEPGTAPAIVGVLMTARAVSVDRSGAVELDVRRLAINVAEEALVKSAGAFLRVGVAEIETYGANVITRAREIYRVLGRMVKIN